MYTPVTTTDLARDDVRPEPDHAGTTPRPATRRPRAWALAGVGAAIASTVGTGLVSVAPTNQAGYTAAEVIEGLEQMRMQIIGFGALCSLSALLLIVFGAGLYRRLRQSLGQDSVLPGVAAAGAFVTAAVTLVGTGFVTEAVSGAGLSGPMAIVFSHVIGTIPWVFAALGLSALAVAAAHRALPRWIVGVSLALGVLTAALGLSPLQYMAQLTGSVWLLVVGLGFVFGDKAHRQGR